MDIRMLIPYNKDTDWTFVLIATLLTCFFGLLVVAMITGFKAVESGIEYNGVILCILGML